MTLKSLAFCVSAVIINCIIYGQPKNNGIDTFEKEIAEFRYSLFEDLNKMSYDDLSEFKFGKNDSLLKKIEKFFDRHKDEIYPYQYRVLERYETFEIDFNSFKQDTDYATTDYWDMWNTSREDLIVHLRREMDSEVWELFTINPLQYANFLVGLYLPYKYSPYELGLYSLQNALAGALTRTEKINNDEWKIFISRYIDLYEFEYNCKSREMKIINRYVRE